MEFSAGKKNGVIIWSFQNDQTASLLYQSGITSGLLQKIWKYPEINTCCLKFFWTLWGSYLRIINQTEADNTLSFWRSCGRSLLFGLSTATPTMGLARGLRSLNRGFTSKTKNECKIIIRNNQKYIEKVEQGCDNRNELKTEKATYWSDKTKTRKDGLVLQKKLK